MVGALVSEHFTLCAVLLNCLIQDSIPIHYSLSISWWVISEAVLRFFYKKIYWLRCQYNYSKHPNIFRNGVARVTFSQFLPTRANTPFFSLSISWWNICLSFSRAFFYSKYFFNPNDSFLLLIPSLSPKYLFLLIYSSANFIFGMQS